MALALYLRGECVFRVLLTDSTCADEVSWSQVSDVCTTALVQGKDYGCF